MLNDKALAFIKTVVPGLWAAAVTFAVAQWAIPETLVTYLNDPITVALILGAGLALWKMFWDWVNPYIPDWASRVLLGSAQTATYVTPPAVLIERDGDGIVIPGEGDDVMAEEELYTDN